MYKILGVNYPICENLSSRLEAFLYLHEFKKVDKGNKLIQKKGFYKIVKVA